MSKNRRGSQVVLCEHCGGSGRVKVQSTKRRRQSARSKGQRFESSVTALASNGWAPGSNGFRPRPTEPEFDPIDQAPLSPGGSRSSRAYRRWSVDDVRVSGWLAFGSGVAIGVPGTVICIALKTEWVWPVLTWVLPPAIVWLAKVKDFFIDDKAIARVQIHDRPTEPAAIVHAPPSAEIVINSGTKQTRAKLSAPKSDHTGLWRYAQALVSGEAAPSYEGGEHVKGAKGFGYGPKEFDAGPGTWRPTAIAAAILKKDPEKSRGYKLTKTGQRAMRAIANGRIGEWG